MKMRVIKVLLIAGAVVLIFLILQDSFTQAGIKDLPGGFEEIAFVRNEQNKGGIIRIYAFTVENTDIADFKACGELLPHNEYGSITKAYFFTKDSAVPVRLALTEPHFDYSQYPILATYVKNENGSSAVY